MDKKKLTKILFSVIIFIVSIVLFFYLNLNIKNPAIEKEKIPEITHNGVVISKILTEENYNKVGINPNKYSTFESFLKDFKSFSGVLVDPIKEKFVIGIKSKNDITFVPFDFKKSEGNFDSLNNKNLAILDIYTSYKNKLLYGGVDSNYGNKILFEKDFQHPKTSELNKIFSVNIHDKSKNVYSIISQLEKTSEIGISNMEYLSYLYDFTGKYSKSAEIKKKICEKDSKKCNNNISVQISGNVLDSNGNNVIGAKIELLNDTSVKTITDEKGYFSLDFKNSGFSHLRFKSSIKGYSDGFGTISLNNVYSDSNNIVINFNLIKSENYLVINNDNRANFKKGKYYIIEGENSKYFIPIDGLYTKDGKKYTGINLGIYTYLFKKSTNMSSMIENDTFEPVYGYVGNIMKTFGMPYIQFFDNETGEELFIKSSNPMILQNQIYHMKELYENHDKIYQELTKEDMKFLVAKSEELGGYPIDFDFLTKNKILRWPAWWSLDRVTGVWHNVGSKVVNVDGLVELPFYHIQDN